MLAKVNLGNDIMSSKGISLFVCNLIYETLTFYFLPSVIYIVLNKNVTVTEWF